MLHRFPLVVECIVQGAVPDLVETENGFILRGEKDRDYTCILR